MTNEELDLLTKEIVANIDLGLDLSGIFAPQIIPAVVIGKSVDKMIPGLATMINSWIEGNPPTDDEKVALREKLAVLGNPDLP